MKHQILPTTEDSYLREAVRGKDKEINIVYVLRSG